MYKTQDFKPHLSFTSNVLNSFPVPDRSYEWPMPNLGPTVAPLSTHVSEYSTAQLCWAGPLDQLKLKERIGEKLRQFFTWSKVGLAASAVCSWEPWSITQFSESLCLCLSLSFSLCPSMCVCTHVYACLHVHALRWTCVCMYGQTRSTPVGDF